MNDLNDLYICTGRWGCGAFKGDEVWKFFIQWIACSYAQRSMIYLSDQKELVDELKYTVRKLVERSKTVLDLFSMMEHFMEVKKRMTKPS
jgi:hypothetical protein